MKKLVFGLSIALLGTVLASGQVAVPTTYSFLSVPSICISNNVGVTNTYAISNYAVPLLLGPSYATNCPGLYYSNRLGFTNYVSASGVATPAGFVGLTNDRTALLSRVPLWHYPLNGTEPTAAGIKSNIMGWIVIKTAADLVGSVPSPTVAGGSNVVTFVFAPVYKADGVYTELPNILGTYVAHSLTITHTNNPIANSPYSVSKFPIYSGQWPMAQAVDLQRVYGLDNTNRVWIHDVSFNAFVP